MSTELDSKFGTASAAEQAVSNALSSLPAGYDVVRNPDGCTVKCQDMDYRYAPDFMVSDPEGRTLMVEVKRPVSMSWSNMARFVEIDRCARESGASFLVLVPGEAARPAVAPFPEFNAVNVAYANDEPGIAKAVIKALRAVPRPVEGAAGWD